ncbi:hypothetical protein [Apibacter sp. HY039]|uniref:hypothetical protein n=1 Tax=Apibacter sp. HY039 TaxID=2501476 RepID=UPI000FEBD69E|nr:hypothetical protein [Apibacter sp. HY039]
MKVLPYFFIPIFLLSINGIAQMDSLDLIIKYKPSTTYTKEEKTFFSIEIQNLGKKKSKKESNTQKIEEKTKYILRTEKESEDFTIPFTLKLVNAQESTINDIIFKGKYKQGEYPQILSVENSSLDIQKKETLKKLIQESLKQSLLINKKIKIGDSFSTTIPFRYPGNNLSEMTLTTTYSLREIKEGKAFFDYIQNYKLNMNTYDTNASGAGTGKGKFIYDISHQYYISDNVDSFLEVETMIDGQPVKLKMNVHTETKNTIL